LLILFGPCVIFVLNNLYCMYIWAIHIRMEIFKVLLSLAFAVRFEFFNVYQTKFFEKNACKGFELVSMFITHTHCCP